MWDPSGVLILAVLIQIVAVFINSCFSVPNALFVIHSSIQMLTLFTLQYFDMLRMHVLTADSFHLLSQHLTFPLTKLQLYFEVISLGISRSSSILFSSNMLYTTRHTKKGGEIYIYQQFVLFIFEKNAQKPGIVFHTMPRIWKILNKHSMSQTLELSLWQSYYF